MIIEDFTVSRPQTYTLFHVTDEGRQMLDRPDADTVFVLHWESADVVIPWPTGLTAKQAIVQWAMNQAPEPTNGTGA